MRHLTTLMDVSRDDVLAIFEIAAQLKAQARTGERPALLQHKVLTQIFEKPSLRTRLSFEAAIVQLGGQCCFFTARDAGLHGREALQDVAKVTGSLSDFVVLRTFEQTMINDFAKWSSCPVINGLSDDHHPCQALTDLFTIKEVFGTLDGLHLAFIGDGNNVATSLAFLCSILDVQMTLVTPPGYEIRPQVVSEIRNRYPHSKFRQTSNYLTAVKNADIVYTDVWTSMGQEDQAEDRRRDFKGFQINEQLMAHSKPTCRFMHDLPAHRGEEVTDAIMDGPQSIVFQQAENRMHLAKGLLVWLDRQRNA